jgi:hypothetical protein
MEFSINDYPELKIYYKFKKLSKNQKEFISSLTNNIVKNLCSIYEFPPTLDKDFLYTSVLYTLARQNKNKFILLCKNYDKVYEIMKNFTTISNICQKYTKLNNLIKIVPFFDRKMMCLNEKLLEDASSLDLDSYCTRATASWVPDNNKCSYYMVWNNLFFLELFKF